MLVQCKLNEFVDVLEWRIDGARVDLHVAVLGVSKVGLMSCERERNLGKK